MKSKGDTTYNTEALKKTCLKAIGQYKLTQVDDIVAFIPCSMKTYYDHNLHKSQEIIDAVNINKIKIKQGIKQKWYKSKNTQAEKYLYLLLGTQEERDALNGTQKVQEHGKLEIEIIDKTIKKVEDE